MQCRLLSSVTWSAEVPSLLFQVGAARRAPSFGSMHLVTSFPMGKAEAASPAPWRQCMTLRERELVALLATFPEVGPKPLACA